MRGAVSATFRRLAISPSFVKPSCQLCQHLLGRKSCGLPSSRSRGWAGSLPLAGRRRACCSTTRVYFHRGASKEQLREGFEDGAAEPARLGEGGGHSMPCTQSASERTEAGRYGTTASGRKAAVQFALIGNTENRSIRKHTKAIQLLTDKVCRTAYQSPSG
jgi:hypothetical protein